MTNLSVTIAFVAGILSFFSPCVFPLIPSYILLISGLSFKEITDAAQTERTRWVIIINSLFFILGFSLVFIILGATASLLGQIFFIYKDVIRIVGGIIVVMLGLYVMGLFQIGFLNVEKRINLPVKTTGYLGSLLAGITFGAAWTPCIGPILGAILLLASSSKTVTTGILYLVVFSLGLAIPFLITAALLQTVIKYITKINRYMGIIKVISGLLLVIIGLLLLTNWFQLLVNFMPPIGI
ncbi:MAG: cytochrome c biogenesis protein CcdA [Candidatus Margulisbacteria bacterium]|nr:cytochrome c biogenesis protein CcdA [Candidatus Margulisiibacteriota bacterium]MBU1022374.1 cytochrome c biogenesis protein CcdA [Candidatus Margulisiibacteriota bacterium]MBU1729074.1 cytochrome c biogenesis protein CcdA [Candidatus Margulisiibacteriota bacterium]MBU1954505.1 cytochrome c biogenesis protein CcdA [Candidatus Margulisiibacteriota bacterium]